MRRAAAAAAAAITIAVGAVGAAPTAIAAPHAAGWAEVRAGLDLLLAQADAAAGGAITPGGPGDSGTPANSPAQVAALLARLDGAAESGAAARAWRGLFGSGAAAIAPGADGAPIAGAHFADSAEAARFLRLRVARARAAVRGRTGSTPATVALDRRIRREAAALASPPHRDVAAGAPTRCGPVRLVAAGDTNALGQLCADLDRYWDGYRSRGAAEVVRVEPHRTGPVPAAEQRVTAAASAVERVASDVDTVSSRPAVQDEPPETQPAADAPQQAAMRRDDRFAPVLAAARRPRTWMPAAGGVAAIVLGLTVLRRVREGWSAGVLR